MPNLSILIPTYNHVCVGLVESLSGQIAKDRLDAEIVVVDDGSTDMSALAANASIESRPCCRYIVSIVNEGIAKTRNKLIDSARGDYLLFMDADTMPLRDDFLRRYVAAATKADIVVGGIAYRREKESCVNPLRYRYGITHEARNFRERSLRPYNNFNSCAFLISRRAMGALRFDETFDRYGHEDVLFGLEAKLAGLSILHIDNPAWHDNTDSAEDYLSKVRISVQSLIMHADKLDGFSHLLNTYKRVAKLRLAPLLARLFRIFRASMERNLLGRRPSMKILAFYKLSYMCGVMTL